MAVFGIVRGAVEGIVSSSERREVFSRGSGTILLVQDKRPEVSQPLWKLPGGRTEPGESWDVTLVREISEEVKITIHRPEQSDRVLRVQLPDHVFLVYCAQYYTGMVEKGDEILRVAVFSHDEVRAMLQWGIILPKYAKALYTYLTLGLSHRERAYTEKEMR